MGISRPPMVAAMATYQVGQQQRQHRRIYRGSNSAWQRELAEHWRNIGEVDSAGTYIGRAMSKATIYAARVEPDQRLERIEDDGPASALARKFLGGHDQAPAHMWTFGTLRTILGEAWIFAEADNTTWHVVADSDVQVEATITPRFSIDDLGGSRRRIADQSIAMHWWQPDPIRRAEVWSPTKASIPILRVIQQINDYLSTTLQSRLASAGLLWLPVGATVWPNPDIGAPPEDVNPTLWLIHEAMKASLANPDSASRHVPITIQGASDDSAPPQYIPLEYPLTDFLRDLLDVYIRRYAWSTDIPPEVLTGMSDTNHWNAWIIDESTLKVHVEPALADLCRIGTQMYLRPALRDESIVLWYDTSELQVRADRSESAIALYDRGELDGEGLRAETGLADHDPPDEQSRLRQVAMTLVRNRPSMADSVFQELGMAPRDTATAGTRLADNGQGAPGAERRDLPQLPAAAQPPDVPSVAALVAAADVVVMDALATTGRSWLRSNRSKARGYRDVDPATLYLREPLDAGARPMGRVVAGAPVWAQVPRIAAAHDADPDCLRDTLVAYTTTLVAEQAPHSPDALAAAIAHCAPAIEAPA